MKVMPQLKNPADHLFYVFLFVVGRNDDEIFTQGDSFDWREILKKRLKRKVYSIQSATKTLVSLVPLLFRLLEKDIFFPSGENIGNASNT